MNNSTEECSAVLEEFFGLLKEARNFKRNSERVLKVEKEESVKNLDVNDNESTNLMENMLRPNQVSVLSSGGVSMMAGTRACDMKNHSKFRIFPTSQRFFAYHYHKVHVPLVVTSSAFRQVLFIFFYNHFWYVPRNHYQTTEFKNLNSVNTYVYSPFP